MKSEQTEGAAIDGDTYRTLLLIALLGAEIGETPLGEQIAELLVDLRPDLPHAEVSLAICRFRSGGTEDGIRQLERTLLKYPDSQMCRAMLGVFMQCQNRPGWQALLESVVEDGRDENAIALACRALGRAKVAVEPSKLEPVAAHAVWA